MSKDGVVRCEGIQLGPERDTSGSNQGQPSRMPHLVRSRIGVSCSPERRRKQKYSARTLAHGETRELRTEPNLGQKLVRMR